MAIAPEVMYRVAQRWSKATTRRLQFSCSNNARVKFPKYIWPASLDRSFLEVEVRRLADAFR